MQYKQMLLFQEDKEEKLEKEIEKLKNQCERVRKSQYAKIGDLSKRYLDLQHEMETLKIAVCRANIA